MNETLDVARAALERYHEVTVDDDGAITFAPRRRASARCRALELDEGLPVLNLTCVVAWDLPRDEDIPTRVALRRRGGPVRHARVIRERARAGTSRSATPSPPPGWSEKAMGTLLMLVVGNASSMRAELTSDRRARRRRTGSAGPTRRASAPSDGGRDDAHRARPLRLRRATAGRSARRPASRRPQVTTASSPKPGSCTHTSRSPAPTTSQYRLGRGWAGTSKRTTTRGRGSPSTGRSSARASTARGTGRGAPGGPPATARPTSRARGTPAPAPARSRSAGSGARGRRTARPRPARSRRAQPLGQDAAREARRALEEVAEPLGPDHQVAHDDRRPPLGEHLGPERDRAVLAVSVHARRRILRGAARRQSDFELLRPDGAAMLAAMTTTARSFWALGDYDRIAELVADLGTEVVAAADVGPGMRVLDVGAGTGNATLPAAAAGRRRGRPPTSRRSCWRSASGAPASAA